LLPRPGQLLLAGVRLGRGDVPIGPAPGGLARRIGPGRRPGPGRAGRAQHDRDHGDDRDAESARRPHRRPLGAAWGAVQGASLRNQTVAPGPTVSWRAASPLTTAISIQPALPIRAIN